MKTSTRRALTAVLAFAIVGVGLAVHTGLGTPSSFGWDVISTVCPVGALEALAANHGIPVRGLACLAIAIILILVTGRAFCAWICPTPLVRRIFRGKKFAERDRSDLKDMPACMQARKVAKAIEAAADAAPAAKQDKVAAQAGEDASPAQAVVTASESVQTPEAAADSQATPAKGKFRLRNGDKDFRLAVLVSAIASSAVFGFPVFCLACPIGLSFATFIGLWRLIQYNEGTWSLLVFPAIIAIELFALRKWCHHICPLSAAMSLAAKGNKTLLPTIDPSKCLRETGKKDCHACKNACPEGIDLHGLASGAPLAECTKCHICEDVCPGEAISFPFMPRTCKPDTRVEAMPSAAGAKAGELELERGATPEAAKEL